MKFDENMWFLMNTPVLFLPAQNYGLAMWFFFGVSNFGQGFTKEVDLISTGSFSCTSTNFWKFLSYSGRSRRDLPRKCSLPKSNATVDVEKIRSKCKIFKNFSFATKILVSCKALTFFFAGGTSRSRRDLPSSEERMQKFIDTAANEPPWDGNFSKKSFSQNFFFQILLPWGLWRALFAVWGLGE